MPPSVLVHRADDPATEARIHFGEPDAHVVRAIRGLFVRPHDVPGQFEGLVGEREAEREPMTDEQATGIDT